MRSCGCCPQWETGCGVWLFYKQNITRNSWIDKYSGIMVPEISAGMSSFSSSFQ